MAKLVLTLHGQVAGHYFLERERFVIGRKEACDLCIDEPGISKEHAAVVTIGNDQILEDLDSTNGTIVNGKRMEKHILQHNDIIEIGPCQFKYINAKATPDMDFDKTMIMPALSTHADAPQKKPAWHSNQLESSSPAAREGKGNFPLAGVRYLRGTEAGKEIELNRVLATFGKADEQLAVINRRPHGYFITHVEGKKFPLLNAKPISAEPYLLREGDVIEVGNDKFMFFVK